MKINLVDGFLERRIDDFQIIVEIIHLKLQLQMTKSDYVVGEHYFSGW